MVSKWTVTLLVAIALAPAANAAEKSSVGNSWRMFINSSCIIADEPYLLPESDDETTARVAPLFGLLAAKLSGVLVNLAIDGFVGGMGAAAARKDTKFVTAQDFNLYIARLDQSPEAAINDRLGCITVVAGKIRPDSHDCSADYIAKEVLVDTLELPQAQWQTTRTDNSIENILKRANICMAEPVQSAYEARLSYSDDKTAFRMNDAGHWINSLTSTNSTRAERIMLYTFEIVEPAEGSGGRVLSTAWVNVGKISAGTTRVGATARGRSDWLRVPPMSLAALKVHQSDTAIHRDVIGKIEAMERAVVRDARLSAALEERAGTSEGAVRTSLESEIAKVTVRIITTEAMLEATRAEYDDLPQATMQYMPVTMRFGVTETRSEKKAMQVLANILEKNKKSLQQAANEMISIDRSLDLESGEPDLAALRADYFDALLALDIGAQDPDENYPGLQRDLETAKQYYNSALAAHGLDPID